MPAYYVRLHVTQPSGPPALTPLGLFVTPAGQAELPAMVRKHLDLGDLSECEFAKIETGAVVFADILLPLDPGRDFPDLSAAEAVENWGETGMAVQFKARIVGQWERFEA